MFILAKPGSCGGRVVVVVTSRPGSGAARAAIRSTWAVWTRDKLKLQSRYGHLTARARSYLKARGQLREEPKHQEAGRCIGGQKTSFSIICIQSVLLHKFYNNLTMPSMFKYCPSDLHLLSVLHAGAVRVR